VDEREVGTSSCGALDGGIPELRGEILTHKGTGGRAKTETSILGVNHYEKLKHNNSGIPSGVWHDCLASSKLGQNFGCNRSSCRDVAGGKSLDWSWLGQFGEGASVGERQWSELQ
jgi:hypothetical protein